MADIRYQMRGLSDESHQQVERGGERQESGNLVIELCARPALLPTTVGRAPVKWSLFILPLHPDNPINTQKCFKYLCPDSCDEE